MASPTLVTEDPPGPSTIGYGADSHSNPESHTIKLTRGIWTLVRIISTVVYIVTPQGLVDTPQVLTQVITSPRTPIYK